MRTTNSECSCSDRDSNKSNKAMEVAGQWRREWAGTAEYGKVTEGGVTKRVARAMEVLHASAPGTRVRVMRAAFHATAGPGAPASSYMLQSSRRVITSGYDFAEPQSIPSKPLEISSLPLEIADTDTDCEKQAYKVTEPDDLDISEPSKWRRRVERNSIRMPSEESSSADNASIIDLDPITLRKNPLKHQILKYDQDNLKPVNPKNRVSPLLDAPVTLSTLKYKNLLTGSEEWNNRRKSYSFEDTAPLNKTILDKKDRFAIESSTDSGICKSSEVVNDVENVRYIKLKERKLETQEESFTDWLYKNRAKIGSHSPKPVKKNSITPERVCENNITMQSSGKVCITLPVTIETESDQEPRISQTNNEENDRKSKKVEFCKTELHFAADTGTVNIIATDEKPPPTNDFRRRRSAFVPISDRFEKSITLFGEKTEFFENCRKGSFSINNVIDFGDYDENTAATKSILKNKIPKPKPYLLGENMILGKDDLNDKECDTNEDDNKTSKVSLINAQLKADKFNPKTTSDYSNDLSAVINISHRTTREDSYQNYSFKNLRPTLEEKGKKIPSKYKTLDNISNNTVERKLQILHKSPTLGRHNSRQLRESDLMYFGIGKNQNTSKQQGNKLHEENNEQEEIFESVRLVRRVSSSVCSSEIESDEAPEYQNLPLGTNNTPVPAPRLRTKYCETHTEANMGNLMSIKEQENDENIPTITRRTKLRRQDTSSPSSRSISEPPKAYRLRTEYKQQDYYRKYAPINSGSIRRKGNVSKKVQREETISQGSTYLYANLKTREVNPSNDNRSGYVIDLNEKPQVKKDKGCSTVHYKTEQFQKHDDGGKKNVCRADSLNSKNNVQYGSQPRTRAKVQRTEKLVTPELPHSGSINKRIKNEETLYNSSQKIPKNILTSEHKDYQKSSRHRHSNLGSNTSNSLKNSEKTIKTEPRKERYNKEVEDKNQKEIIKKSWNNNTSKSSSKSQPDLVINASSKQKNKMVESPKKHRSEYVINYDDKEGTVSSVRKVRKPSKYNSSDKKYPTQENKENLNEQNVKIKQLNKIALQKISDRYGKLYKERASRVKTYVERPCQLL